jgi:adenine-specific DNA-methyltransferase
MTIDALDPGAKSSNTTVPTRYGDDDHQIWHADALSALEQVPDASCALIFADPPYNIGKRYKEFHDKWPDDRTYAEWCEQWLLQCFRKLTPNGSLYIMASTQSMPYIDIFVRSHVTVLSRIVWHYDSSGVQARKYFGSLWEPILHCVNDAKNYVFNAGDIKVEAKTGAARKLIDYRKEVPTVYSSEKVPGNAWYFPRVRFRMDEFEDHPSQKPEALMERIIRASSNEGDLVLDPFAGTFTTCAVAQRLGRRSIGIELAEEYVGIGLRRLGLATELNGKPLTQLDKKRPQRNRNGVKYLATSQTPLML